MKTQIQNVNLIAFTNKPVSGQNTQMFPAFYPLTSDKGKEYGRCQIRVETSYQDGRPYKTLQSIILNQNEGKSFDRTNKLQRISGKGYRMKTISLAKFVELINKDASENDFFNAPDFQGTSYIPESSINQSLFDIPKAEQEQIGVILELHDYVSVYVHHSDNFEVKNGKEYRIIGVSTISNEDAIAQAEKSLQAKRDAGNTIKSYNVISQLVPQVEEMPVGDEIPE